MFFVTLVIPPTCKSCRWGRVVPLASTLVQEADTLGDSAESQDAPESESPCTWCMRGWVWHTGGCRTTRARQTHTDLAYVRVKCLAPWPAERPRRDAASKPIDAHCVAHETHAPSASQTAETPNRCLCRQRFSECHRRDTIAARVQYPFVADTRQCQTCRRIGRVGRIGKVGRIGRIGRVGRVPASDAQSWATRVHPRGKTCIRSAQRGCVE
jgi:hypothetical protein